MFRHFRSVALFLAGLALVDLGAGSALSGMQEPIMSGDWTGGLVNAALARRSEMVILGSSQARRHVDPAVLSPRLGVSAHNAGCDGQGIAYALGVSSLLLRSSAPPRFMVLDVNTDDLRRDSRNRINILAPFYGRASELDALLESRGPFARAKLVSRLYRFNSLALSILRRSLGEATEPSNGFDPLPPRPFTRWRHEPLTFPDDAVARGLSSYRTLIELAQAHGVTLVFVVSPRSTPRSPADAHALSQIAALASSLGVPWLNLEAEAPRLGLDEGYFIDSLHLDSRGAHVYSVHLAERLREYVVDEG